MNWYEEKQEAKRERLEDRAERLRREGDAKVKSGFDRLKAIPFGQPILVGHHSEKRDRNYRAKACGAIDKGFELQQAAGEVAARAAAIGTGGISSDDPDAVVKLKEKIEAAEALQAKMTAANKIVRKFKKPEDRQNGMMALEQQGFTAGQAQRLFDPDFCGRLGFPGFELTNNGANIRRMKERVEHLARNATRETKETERADGIRIVENAEINRLQIFFPGKPAADVRTKLKSYGFRWSPTEGAWQRQLSNGAKWAAESVTTCDMHNLSVGKNR